MPTPQCKEDLLVSVHPVHCWERHDMDVEQWLPEASKWSERSSVEECMCELLHYDGSAITWSRRFTEVSRGSTYPRWQTDHVRFDNADKMTTWLAMVHGIQRHHTNLCRSSFTVIKYHKQLVTTIAKPLHADQLESKANVFNGPKFGQHDMHSLLHEGHQSFEKKRRIARDCV